MQIEVKYFGMVAEAAGKSSEEIELITSSNVRALKSLLENKYSTLEDMSYKVAVNQAIADEDAIIESNYEVALLPPFAGG